MSSTCPHVLKYSQSLTDPLHQFICGRSWYPSPICSRTAKLIPKLNCISSSITNLHSLLNYRGWNISRTFFIVFEFSRTFDEFFLWGIHWDTFLLVVDFRHLLADTDNNCSPSLSALWLINKHKSITDPRALIAKLNKVVLSVI